MKNSINILIAIFTITYGEGLACSCTSVPETFNRSISVKHIIFEGTVLEHIDIPNDSNYLQIYYRSLTKIKVNNWYQNKMKEDTIFYANGDGTTCTESVDKFKVGERVIIKSLKASIYDFHLQFRASPDIRLNEFMREYTLKPIVVSGICDVSLLSIKDDLVVGNITKNHGANRGRFINFIKPLNKKWANKLKDKWRSSKRQYQEWSIEKFDLFMRQRWNSLVN